MKIIFFRETEVKDILAPIGLGATETCVIELARELAKDNFVKVICPCTSGIYDNVQYYNHVDYVNSVKFMIDFGPDIVIIVGNPKILFYKIKFSCKVIFWQHNHPDEMSFNIQELLQDRQNLKIVFPSYESAEYASKVYQYEIFGIYNGVRDIFSKFRNIDKEKNSICYVGAFARTKGVLEVLKIAIQLPEYRFYICGSFDMYGYHDYEYEKVCKEIISDNIVFTGALKPVELAKRISSSELCIVNPIVGNKETCCVSALESMLAGTPVIAGGNSIIESIINHGGICYNTNLAESITQLMQNKEKRQQLSESGFKWASQLSWQNVASQWSNFLNSL